jgi:hypothetical protein
MCLYVCNYKHEAASSQIERIYINVIVYKTKFHDSCVLKLNYLQNKLIYSINLLFLLVYTSRLIVFFIIKFETTVILFLRIYKV